MIFQSFTVLNVRCILSVYWLHSLQITANCPCRC